MQLLYEQNLFLLTIHRKPMIRKKDLLYQRLQQKTFILLRSLLHHLTNMPILHLIKRKIDNWNIKVTYFHFKTEIRMIYL